MPSPPQTETMEVYSEVYMERGIGPELIGQFLYSDIAEWAARAICERYHYKITVKSVNARNGPFADTVFEWGVKEVECVVRADPVGPGIPGQEGRERHEALQNDNRDLE